MASDPAISRLRHVTVCVSSSKTSSGHSEKAKELIDQHSKKIPLRNDFSKEACVRRRQWLEHQINVKLPAIGQFINGQDTTKLKGNIEQPIGLAKVPLAVVGPLRVNGEDAKGEFFAPFATTEGALTASVMRGVNAINAGSGAIVCTGDYHVTRGPCFVTRNPKEAIMLGNYVKKNKQRIQEEVVRKVTNFGVLKDVLPIYDMEAVHIILQFTTGDASGQNMVAVCTAAIIDWLREQIPHEEPGILIKHAWVENNATSDKKPGALNALTTRGIAVQASCIINEEALNKQLQITSDEYLTFVHYSTRMTQKVTPFGGLHINPSNSLTAMFIATGQDVAAVQDSTTGSMFEVVTNEGAGGGIKVSLTLPSLIVGTVGGGTGLPTQQEGLAIMGCQGSGKVRKLAEVMTAFAMALDLSSSTALANGMFAGGHDRHGRNRPEDKSDISYMNLLRYF